MKRVVALALVLSIIFSGFSGIVFGDKKIDGLKKELDELIKKENGYFSIGIKDLKTGETIYINDTQIKSASVIKVFVMAAAYKKIKEGKLDPKKTITLTSDMKVGGTGILQGMKNGTKKTMEELIELMITVSDNTASNMVVRELGFDYINKTIAEIGCKDTKLGYYFILTAPKGVRNTISVRDLNLFYEMLYTNSYLGKEYDQKMIKIMSKVSNKTKLVSLLPKGTVVAHKTGCIIAHEHDAGIVFGPKKDYLISVLAKDLKNPNRGIQVIQKISKTAFDYLNK